MDNSGPEQHLREDGELVGLLVPAENSQWVPCTIFGVPLSGALPRGEAERYLADNGLSALAEQWELQQGKDWISVQIAEARPSSVTIRYVDYGHPDLFGSTHTLTPTNAQNLRRR